MSGFLHEGMLTAGTTVQISPARDSSQTCESAYKYGLHSSPKL